MRDANMMSIKPVKPILIKNKILSFNKMNKQKSLRQIACDRFERNNLRQCSHSLQFLVRYYRYFGYSFSGTIIITGNQKRNRWPWRSLLAIAHNIAMIVFCILPSFRTHRQATTNEFTINEIFGVEFYKHKSSNLKFMLSIITQIVFHTLLFETLLSYVANLVIGGSLIRTLADVALRFDPKFDQIDVRRIRRLLMIKSMLIISFLASGLAIFFRSRVYALWRITFGGDVSGDDQLIDDRARQEAKLMACLFTFHAIAYTIQLMWPCFFWYSMSLVARKIRSIRHVIERAGERKFDVAELEPLKGRLLSLNAAFDRINRIFAIPLSIILSLSVLTLIGVACFLVLNGGRQYFVPLLFSYGLFAISRLLLIGYAANLPQNECRELTRVTLECVREWTPNGMLTYLEIRRLSGRFVVRIGHFAIVRQSTIVSLFAFALSYIVILLQTENYQDTSVTAFAGSDDQRNNQTFENVTSNIIESVLWLVF